MTLGERIKPDVVINIPLQDVRMYLDPGQADTFINLAGIVNGVYENREDEVIKLPARLMAKKLDSEQADNIIKLCGLMEEGLREEGKPMVFVELVGIPEMTLDEMLGYEGRLNEAMGL